MLQRIRWFLLIFGIAVVSILAVWNTDEVTLQLPLLEDRTLPLSMLLFVFSASSFIFGAIMTGWMLRGRRKAAVAKEKAAINEAKTTSTDDSMMSSVLD